MPVVEPDSRIQAIKSLSVRARYAHNYLCQGGYFRLNPHSETGSHSLYTEDDMEVYGCDGIVLEELIQAGLMRVVIDRGWNRYVINHDPLLLGGGEREIKLHPDSIYEFAKCWPGKTPDGVLNLVFAYVEEQEEHLLTGPYLAEDELDQRIIVRAEYLAKQVFISDVPEGVWDYIKFDNDDYYDSLDDYEPDSDDEYWHGTRCGMVSV